MKKKKIGKIIKYIGFTIILIWTIILAIVGCQKEVHGLSYDNYGYRYILDFRGLSMSEYDSNYYRLSSIPKCLYYWDGTRWTRGNDPNNSIDSDMFIQRVLDYTDGLSISFSNITFNTCYLIGTIDNIHIYKITTIDIYSDYMTTKFYNEGLSAGLDASNTESYDQGYSVGYNKGIQEGQIQVNNTINQYEATIESLNEDIAYYQGIINDGTTPWGSFQSLLGTIFLFPVKFFKEGFDVDIFGVNVGGLIIGLGMIGITLTIIGEILGRRSTT